MEFTRKFGESSQRRHHYPKRHGVQCSQLFSINCVPLFTNLLLIKSTLFSREIILYFYCYRNNEIIQSGWIYITFRAVPILNQHQSIYHLARYLTKCFGEFLNLDAVRKTQQPPHFPTSSLEQTWFILVYGRKWSLSSTVPVGGSTMVVMLDDSLFGSTCPKCRAELLSKGAPPGWWVRSAYTELPAFPSTIYVQWPPVWTMLAQNLIHYFDNSPHCFDNSPLTIQNVTLTTLTGK